MTRITWPAGPFPPVREPFGPYGEDVPPTITVKGKKYRLRMAPGEGINASPFEAEALLDLTFPLGHGSGMIYGIMFQMGRWGYETKKVSHALDVSPVFTEYYQRTMEEKRRLEEQVKAGFASLSTAISDFELLWHDVRKYEDYLNYFTELEQAKKAKDEEREKRAHHILRAMFVDEVDAHTGEGISLRSIAPRWPTIISDFMQLTDEEVTPEDIVKKLKITLPEAVVLATKNKLYKDWRDVFLTTVTERYGRLKRMMESRRQSIEEYRNQLKPLISRYKTMAEIRAGGVSFLDRISWFRPDAQAVSIDVTTIWGWRPFIAPEVFKMPRESYDRISLKEAGFTDEEIKELNEDNIYDAPPLPAVPIVDDPLRAIIAQIEEKYNTKISAKDIYAVIKDLSDRYGPPVRPKSIKPGLRWQFSPYFVFVLMDVTRTVIRTADGSVSEDIWIEPLKTFNCTQNIILGRMLEVKAIDDENVREIAALVGEGLFEGGKFKSIDDFLKEKYPELYGGERKEEGEKKKRPFFDELGKMRENVDKIKTKIADFFGKFGINLMFAYPATYEKFMHERMAKMMQLGPGHAFIYISDYLKRACGVPGVEVRPVIH